MIVVDRFKNTLNSPQSIVQNQSNFHPRITRKDTKKSNHLGLSKSMIEFNSLIKERKF
jgi:hypothetical protein